ncbi:(-)-germacrene D synthase [Acorus calamus]|uniref:(-)-germacrene D synthase n=1 Tax=Acorus calamus TaxID=4465 RepID=A0AAV9EBI6_ACOCL|nr:(-)-germacrene D synthase [Acorus calamus]
MDIGRALDIPLRRGMERIQARQYIDVYERDEKRCDELLELAKLDYNRVQWLLQKELKDLSVWWKDLGLIKKLSFARDRLVECYFWSLGPCHEPHQSRSRRVFTKVIVLFSLMDDIYDVHGTLEELIPFNNVIQRRDMEGMKQIPEYMQVFIHALEGTYKEIEEELLVEGNSYRMGYLKEVVKRLSGAYLQEATWGFQKYVPSFKEHLKVSLQTCGYPSLHCVSLVGAVAEDNVTKDAFDWVISVPRITLSSATVCRLLDDIHDLNQDKEEREMISTVECYMSERGISVEAALSEFRKMINNAWKNINEELLNASTFPVAAVLGPAHRLACMMQVIYNNYDSYNHPAGEMKDKIAMLVVDPVPI